MKKNFFNLFWALSVLVPCSMASCSSEDIWGEITQTEDDNKAKTCELVLDIEKISYDDETPTRTVSQWTDGDKIYLTFSTATGFAYGDAIYNSGSWSLNYYGSLSNGVASQCKAVYFENAKFESGSVVQVSEETAIYEDTNGQYGYNDGVLSVTAALSPKTGRIRFAGENADSITIYGISHYTSYDFSTGKYASSSGALMTSVVSDYTPYLYGSFTDSISPRLNIITASSGFTRFLPNTVYRKGESGYITIPSETSHIGWQQSVIFKVNGVEFTMIPVEYSKGFFLLAETETTEQLYNAIVGGTVSNSLLPKNGLYESEWKNTFISNLNYLTELNFYIPSLAEWQYAFKGGNKTQNFRYSGSNTITDVAWCAENSDGKRHEVKQLQPNELGFYDMSGNVSEYISDKTYCYGGYFKSSDVSVSSSISYNETYYESCRGLRFALKP